MSLKPYIEPARHQPADTTLLVISLWRQGADTTEIAYRTRLSEAEVYRITSARPKSTRPSANTFAGAE